MPVKNRPTSDDDEPRGPTREEIETLCLLHVIHQHGCRASDLAALLGLSPGLAATVAQCAEPLVKAGWVDAKEDRLSLTSAGEQWLHERSSSPLSR